MDSKSKTVLFLCLLFLVYSGCGSPNKPEQPKLRAMIQVNVKDEGDLGFEYRWVYDSYCAEFTVIVSEHNGVGGTVTICQLEFFEETDSVQKNTYSGGTFPPNGTCEIDCDPKVPSRYEFDKMTITVKGADNNGYSFEKSISYTYTWSTNNIKTLTR